MQIRDFENGDIGEIFEIINSAAQKYKGQIPDECWHSPYMPIEELNSEIANGVNFRVLHKDGKILGVMGWQIIKDKTLIRHAYISPKEQGTGIGTALIKDIVSKSKFPILIGTWKAATWAIGFYEKNGFETLDEKETRRLLSIYWHINELQLNSSIVLQQII